MDVPWCDIKDVTKAHYRGLVRPDCANKRYIIDAGSPCWFDEVPHMLEEGLAENGKGGYPIHKKIMPGWILGAIGLFNAQASEAHQTINKETNLDNTRARNDLGIEFKKSFKEILTETALCLIKLGAIEDKPLKV